MWRPEKIISGGQTGAEIGGLVGAERCGIDAGGCAPRDFKTESGPQPLLATRFGLIAHPSPNYHDRTKENVEKADATVIFATNASCAGTKLTVELCKQLKKPWALTDPNLDLAHPGYALHDAKGRKSGNNRNGYTSKTLKGHHGEIVIDIPRDREASFAP